MTTLDQAYEMGAKGAEPTEAERLLFEAWIKGHCWLVEGDWDGKTYVHDSERSGYLHPGAMRSRQLWAAWRDRAALAEQPAQGCNYCNHALYSGTKCKNCGRVTEQAAIKRDLTPEQPAQQEPVLEFTKVTGGVEWRWLKGLNGNNFKVGDKLYTSPPAAQQEPVAWATRMGEYAHIHWGAKRPEYPMVYEVPLYTSPLASKPLTDDEFISMVDSAGIAIDPGLAFEIKEMVEAAHGIKEQP